MATISSEKPNAKRYSAAVSVSVMVNHVVSHADFCGRSKCQFRVHRSRPSHHSEYIQDSLEERPAGIAALPDFRENRTVPQKQDSDFA